MDNLLTPPTPYIRLPSSDNNNDPRLNKVPILTIKRILIGCLIGLLLVSLFIISIKLVLSMKSSTIYNTTTTILNQSPIILASTVKVTFPPKPCSIPAINAKWKTEAIVFINPLDRCLSNEYGLCHPRDLFIDDIHDTLYVTDMNNHRIQKYSLTETYNSQVGAAGITVASKGLILPESVFVDIYTEDMYIMDIDQEQKFDPINVIFYRVHLWKKNEKVGRILFSEAGESQFGDVPHRLTLDKQMNIYVGTTYFIKKWLVSTNYTEKIIIAGKGEYNSRESTNLWDPVAFFVTDDLTLYVADWENKRIQKWKVNATEGTTIIGNLTYVMGITMDCNGYLYFVEASYTINQLNMMTNKSRKIVRSEDNLEQRFLMWPVSIKLDKFGNIFILGNNQIHKLSIIHK